MPVLKGPLTQPPISSREGVVLEKQVDSQPKYDQEEKHSSCILVGVLVGARLLDGELDGRRVGEFVGKDEVGIFVGALVVGDLEGDSVGFPE